MFKKEKIKWIEYLKTFGILAVILGHIATPLGGFIFSWHMPLFFIISGFFIKFNLSFKDFFIKNFKRLMIPYFIFSFFAILMEAIKRILMNKEGLDYLNEFYGIFIGMDINHLINSYAFVLWFLPALFFGRLIIFLINKFTTNILYQTTIIIVLFCISFIVELPFGIDNAMNSLLWIYIGYLYINFKKNIKYTPNKNFINISYIILLLIISIIYIYYGIPKLDLSYKLYNNIIINLLWSISIIYLFSILFKAIKYHSNDNTLNNIVKLWGGNTLLLFIIHPYTNNLSYYIVEKINYGDWYLKFIISLIFLQILLLIKIKYKNTIIFKYF